jgi:hypothetical protein
LGGEPLVSVVPEHGMRKRTIEKELLPYGNTYANYEKLKEE